MTSDSAGARLARGLEAILALAVVASVAAAGWFFLRRGHLPAPFFFDTNDTFMDWFNTAYWANNPGTYDVYKSVYPPLSFDFLRLFTRHDCYRLDAMAARDCDPLFAWVLGGFYLLNVGLVFRCYRARDRRTAWMRATALCLGLPMLFALERGQLIIPCFTAFVLAHGCLLRSAWGRWVAAAVTINFKPYLILTLIPQLLKRRWAAFEGGLLAVAAIYLLSYAILGVGGPLEILRNILNFNDMTPIDRFKALAYQPTYRALTDALSTSIPFTHFLGSRAVESASVLAPLLIRAGQAGVVACFAGAVWRPNAVPMHRLTALSVALAITASLAGGYTQIFLFFLVFLEKGRGPARLLALVTAYLLCVTFDLQLVTFAHTVEPSYLGGGVTDYKLGLTLGEVLRPGLILLIEYALVAASLADIWRARGDRVRGSVLRASPAAGVA